MANLKYVVTNDRFLLLPTVRVENLASHVLALALPTRGRNGSSAAFGSMITG